jgi:hypothetical protein
MNSVALDAGTKNSAVKTRIDVCQRGGDVTDHAIAPMAPMNAIVHPIKVRGGCENKIFTVFLFLVDWFSIPDSVR